MRIYLFLFSLLLAGWGITGCQNSPLYEQDVQLMAELQCEARRLKEERFAMANRLRFRDDSLMKYHISLTGQQRQEADSIRTTLTVRTSEVAVRLTRTMDSLFDIHYQTVEQRQAFDAAIARKVDEWCR
jgi:hypothetical protein